MSHTLLKIRTKPNAHQFRYQWLDESTLKIEVPAPPEKNKANEYLLQHLSKLLNIPSQNIQIKAGKTARHKYLLIPLPIETIRQLLPPSRT